VAPDPRQGAAPPPPTPQPTTRRRLTLGPTPTLPPNQQPPPTNRNQRTQGPAPDVDHDLVLDQSRAIVTEAERDGDLALEETALRAHRELAEADQARPAEEPEPLGRRLPEPLEAARQEVER
jgi:hypothetical protein